MPVKSSMVLTPDERRKTQFKVPVQDLNWKRVGIPGMQQDEESQYSWNLNPLLEEQLSLKMFSFVFLCRNAKMKHARTKSP